MKKHLFILFILIFQLKVTAQIKQIEYNTEIIYKFTYKNDSTSSGLQKDILTQLMIGDKESHFQTLSKAKGDSALALANYKGTFYRYGGINPNNFLIVKKGEIIQTFEPVNGVGLSGNNELSYYEQSKKELHWKIHTDTMHRATFVAQKATLDWGGRKWTAWFTMDIPISEGPYKFCGLPGLLVSISDQDNYFTFDLISVRPVKRMSLSFENIRPNLSLIKTTSNDFYSSRKKLRNNMIGYGLLTGAKFNEETKQSIILETKADNNFIERY